ncbi:hypothetical protein Ocin01_05516 [Orchesella cincta]|uniref:WH2 domain-containing protein n=1 Tax=Orchesella cincta TaxID=48709 RepID=A0A1D2N7C8_ORCCI|nr:hypothetical protein Ocin01_05516 [Orchesella cincta]
MPIPPPPPGPPPPPAPPSFAAPPVGGGAPDPNGRNLLLQSIRQGAKLKKAPVVNDRSTPLVSGAEYVNRPETEENNCFLAWRGDLIFITRISERIAIARSENSRCIEIGRHEGIF